MYVAAQIFYKAVKHSQAKKINYNFILNMQQYRDIKFLIIISKVKVHFEFIEDNEKMLSQGRRNIIMAMNLISLITHFRSHPKNPLFKNAINYRFYTPVLQSRFGS